MEQLVSFLQGIGLTAKDALEMANHIMTRQAINSGIKGALETVNPLKASQTVGAAQGPGFGRSPHDDTMTLGNRRIPTTPGTTMDLPIPDAMPKDATELQRLYYLASQKEKPAIDQPEFPDAPVENRSRYQLRSR
jgi:hypothetical protein